MTRLSSYRYLQLLVVVAAIVSCLCVVLTSAKYGLSQVLSIYALMTSSSAAAKQATQLAPKDARAHFANGALLSISGKPDQGVLEFERAVALRPADYALWFELGLLRDQIGDTQGALRAFDEAVRRAPYYSRPRWARGNVLLRNGQYENAFSDLRHAAKSNPALIPNLVDLAWGISRNDVKLTEELAQINTDPLRIAFAQLLVRRNKPSEAVAQFGAARSVPEIVKRELVEQLLAKAAFKEAFIIWQGPHATEAAGPGIHDGGFEAPLSQGDGGFGWRLPRDLPAISMSLDSTQPHSGSKNLRVEFDGNSNPDLPVVSQVLLVEPSKHYQINFASRSHELVTGGLPFVLAASVSGEPKRLGQSPPLAKGTGDWQGYSFEFTTSPQTTAVLLAVQRESCTTSPCPAFGSISLDSFALEQLK